MTLPFDRVVVGRPDSERSLPASEFLSLSLARRLRLVIEGRLRFLLGTREIDQSSALQALRDWKLAHPDQG
jgi:hypothetical protein